MSNTQLISSLTSLLCQSHCLTADVLFAELHGLSQSLMHLQDERVLQHCLPLLYGTIDKIGRNLDPDSFEKSSSFSRCSHSSISSLEKPLLACTIWWLSSLSKNHHCSNGCEADLATGFRRAAQDLDIAMETEHHSFHMDGITFYWSPTRSDPSSL
jgi:hypothetical protein